MLGRTVERYWQEHIQPSKQAGRPPFSTQNPEHNYYPAAEGPENSR